MEFAKSFSDWTRFITLDTASTRSGNPFVEAEKERIALKGTFPPASCSLRTLSRNCWQT